MTACRIPRRVPARARVAGVALLVSSFVAPVPVAAEPPAPAGTPAAPAAASAPAPSADALTWLAGAWTERRDGAVIEEQWMAPRGGVMLGMSRSTGPDGKVFFEFMRIAPSAAGLSYFASPLGRPAVEFPLVALAGRRAVFENDAHDFPQRIIYWLEEGGVLRARIEGTVDGTLQSAEYRWSRAGG